MIVALVHGNEICGAIALDYLLRKMIRPSRGRLTLCFANVDAFARYDRDKPGAARFIDEDMNRLWDAATLAAPVRWRRWSKRRTFFWTCILCSCAADR